MLMGSYDRKQFKSLTHYVYQFCSKHAGILLGMLIIIILPFIHIGIFYRLLWVPNKPAVDRTTCSCSCFDTIFKGSYENPAHVSYKHVYFNATAESFKIWTLTALFVVMCYESVKYLVSLFRKHCLRSSMFCLYLVNIYPHYYSWWSIFNYYNDEFFSYFNHQIYFSLSEIVVTAIVLNLCNSKTDLSARKILGITIISLDHILVSSSDQFISNILLSQGKAYQNSRDLGLMIPDILHTFVPLTVYFLRSKDKGISFTQIFTKQDMVFSFMLILAGVVIGWIL